MLVKYGGTTLRSRLNAAAAGVSVITFLACLAGVGATAYVGHAGNEAASSLAPLADQVMEMHLGISNAFLGTIDPASVAEPPHASLEEARRAADVLLNGGTYGDRSVAATNDPQVRAAIERAVQQIDGMERANNALQRALSDGDAARAAEAHAQLREHYAALTSSAELAEARLWAAISRDVHNVRLGTNVASAALLVLGLLVAWIASAFGRSFGQSLLTPLGEAIGLAEAVARGDLRARFHVDTGGMAELDALGLALDGMVEHLATLVTALDSSANTLGASSTQLSHSSNDVTEQINDVHQRTQTVDVATRQTLDCVSNVAGRVHAIRASADQILVSANEMGSRLDQLACGIGGVSGNVEGVEDAVNSLEGQIATLASTHHQMTASLSEVSSGIARAAQLADQANHRTSQTAADMGALGDAAKQIDDIVKLIAGIADQTNLLALNATIEAAAAGEAGRGFAVVAQAVKELAAQSAKASHDIRGRVRLIQERSDGAIEAIRGVASVVNEVSDLTVSMATAIEEQTTTASNIAYSASNAAEIVLALHGETQSASGQAREMAGEVESTAMLVQAVIAQIGRLRDEVNQVASEANRAEVSVHDSERELVAMTHAAQQTQAAANSAGDAASGLLDLAQQLQGRVRAFAF